MWRTVSFLTAQALLSSCSEARMFTIREVMMVSCAGYGIPGAHLTWLGWL
jgi:hypothetical protein